MDDSARATDSLSAKADLLSRKLDGNSYIVKLAADRVVAVIGLLLLALPVLVVAAFIKLDSPGPIFHRQVRVGRRGQLFTMYKFRSMVDGAEELLPGLAADSGRDKRLFKLRQDPRITRVGNFLRRTSLDELPQLINVVRGEMSLVGPRPPFLREVQEYQPWQMVRLEAVPGMTGLWQVSGRSELSFEEMVRLDMEYIDHWSLLLDMRILLRTVPSLINGRGAW